MKIFSRKQTFMTSFIRKHLKTYLYKIKEEQEEGKGGTQDIKDLTNTEQPGEVPRYPLGTGCRKQPIWTVKQIMMERFPQMKANLIQSLKPCLSTQKVLIYMLQVC